MNLLVSTVEIIYTNKSNQNFKFKSIVGGFLPPPMPAYPVPQPEPAAEQPHWK